MSERFDPTYTLYGLRLSLFTRKMEAALQLQSVPHVYRAKTVFLRRRLEARAGTHLIPLLETPERWLLYDSTPLIELLGARYPRTNLLPSGAGGLLVRLAEEWLDEWFGRAALHYRWNYEESRRVAAPNLAGEMTPYTPRLFRERLSGTIADWGRRACRAFGLDSQTQRSGIEDEARRLFGALEAQLERSAYALGERPTAVDAALLGVLRAHMLPDPAPRKLLASYPRVVEWSASATGAPQGPHSRDGRAVPTPTGGERRHDGGIPVPQQSATIGDPAIDDAGPFARAVLELAGETFLAFASENRRACARGDRVFHATVYGEETSFLARPEMERSRRLLVSRVNQYGFGPALAALAMRAGDPRWVELWENP